jgi:hypothetical protein
MAPPIIYAHRGFWTSKKEQNSKVAIERAKNFGFGVEVDFRSHKGELVLSHNPLLDGGYPVAVELDFENIPVACNLKEDGLANLIGTFVEKYRNISSFVFDGSIPEMLKIRERNIPHAMRVSEYEQSLPWNSHFVWIDSFHSEWWIGSELLFNLAANHFLVFVSPELHGRDHTQSWSYLKTIHERHGLNFGICTDYPELFRKLLDE